MRGIKRKKRRANLLLAWYFLEISALAN